MDSDRNRTVAVTTPTLAVPLTAERILETLGDMVVVVDPRCRVVYQGRGLCRALGYTEGGLLGRLLPEFVHVDDQDRMLAVLDPLLTPPLSDGAVPVEEARCTVRWAHLSGEWQAVSMVARRQAETGHVVISGRDVTDSHQREQGLQQARARAEESGQAKADFLAMMSHEIRTPMSGIIGLIDLLRGTELNTRQQDYVRALVQAGEHLSDLLNDILDFSKIEANHLEIEAVAFDLRKLAGAVMDIFRARAEAKGIALRGSVAPDLSRWWKGDARHLRQVLANLIGNAVKFTDNGHVEVKVTARGTPGPGDLQMLEFSISDTGIGIAESQKSQLFQPFVQADISNTRRHGGTGLGLAISKRLVEAMGGAISVTSQRHVGSTFHFTLPAQPIEAPRGQVVPLDPARPFDGRILVVDDSDLNRMVLGDMLERFGLSVSTALNGLEALDKVRKEPGFSLIFMDIQMPVMDGFSAIEAIRRQEKASGTAAVPILALSATALREDRERALALGCNDYVVKPLRKDVLLTLLRTYCPAKDGNRSLSDLEQQPVEPVTEPAAVTVLEPELVALVPVFLSGVAEDLAALRRAAGGGDAAGVRRSAHTMKGNAMLFGFQELVDCLRALEAVGHEQAVSGGSAETLRGLCAPQISRLETLLQDLAGRAGPS